MATIVTRAGKGSPLTHNEVDANFTNLNTDKLESGSTAASLTVTSADINGGTIDGTVIGGSTPAAISGTTGSFSGNLTVDTNTLFVDAANNRVGIGTSSPTGLLTLGLAAPRIDFLESNGSAGFDNTILIRDADVFSIQTRNGGTFVSNDYRMTTDAAGALTHEWRTGNTERMRITSTGSVGIGTSSPARALHISGTGVSDSRLRVTRSGADGEIGIVSELLLISALGTDGTDGGIRVDAGGSEKMRITSTGNVGIGTSSPGATLHVASGSGANDDFDLRISEFRPNIVFEDLSGTLGTDWQIFVDGDDLQFRYGDASTNTKLANEAMRIDSSGNVGIGTSSPTNLLDVDADSIRVRTAQTPASASATGNQGEIAWDVDYIYVCVATNTWKRAALTTW